jgi:hypothetical protein
MELTLNRVIYYSNMADRSKAFPRSEEESDSSDAVIG